MFYPSLALSNKVYLYDHTKSRWICCPTTTKSCLRIYLQIHRLFHTLFKEVIMENRTYYYARVSTKEQNLDRQLNAFRQLGATERDIVTDKAIRH